MTRRDRVLVILIAGLVCAGVLAACSNKKAAATGATPASSTSSDAARAGLGRGLFNDPRVKQCLDAAGLTLPTPTFTGPRPSFSEGARPSFSPGANPSFTGRPGGGIFGNTAEGQKIRQALEACGISLPTRGPRPTDAPTAAPSSTG